MPKSRGQRTGGQKAPAWEQPITDEAEIRSDFVPAYRLGIVATGDLTVHPGPVEPPDFRKAAAAKPALREELHLLLRTYERDDLVTLANALRRSVGERPSGPHRYPVPPEAARKALAWAIRIGPAAAREPARRRARKVREMVAAAVAEIAPLLPPSAGHDTRASRAKAVLDTALARPPQGGIAAPVARALLGKRARQGGG
jgi:hypothetical protein